VSRLLCILWERYASWSRGQLPAVYNARAWAAYWQGNEYSNAKLKRLVGWNPKVPTVVGLARYFQYCRQAAESK
jgi:nucleoside-diphosphate-sugar epimerase